MFQHDQNFLNDYNNIIFNAQEAILKLNEKFIGEEIEKVNNEINNYKDEFSKNTKYSQFEYEAIKKAVLDHEEGFMKEIFAQKILKAERCQVKEFKVENFKKRQNDNKTNKDSFRSKKINKSVSINNQTQVTEYLVSDTSLSSNESTENYSTYKHKQSTPNNNRKKMNKVRDNSKERYDRRRGNRSRSIKRDDS